MARVLYLSYDGMTDPLGQSQVLPYLTGLAARGHTITLISFEKADAARDTSERVRRSCEETGISWVPRRYHKWPPVISTLADLFVMKHTAKAMQRSAPFDIVHCRSYISALCGLSMKRRFGTRFLFDMRGFWADERVDGGIWTMRNPLHRIIFGFFKRKEAAFFAEADAIVSLTEAGKYVIQNRDDRPQPGPIAVIPCCVDFDAFRRRSLKERDSIRAALGMNSDATLVISLGSVGTWYLLEEMLDAFAALREHEPGAIFLFVTRDDPEHIRAIARVRGVSETALRILAANRDEVIDYLTASDVGLFFIKPVFSKLASSPTKLGELMAVEIPVITNRGVGDVDRIIEDSGAGVLVSGFDPQSYRDAFAQIDRVDPSSERARRIAREWFDLTIGIERYDGLYKGLTSRSNSATSCDAVASSE